MKKNVEFKNGSMVVTLTVEEVCRAFNDATAHFPVYNEEKDAWKFSTLDCDLHFVKDKKAFARLVESAYMSQTVTVLTTKINAIKKAEEENRATLEQSKSRKSLEDLRTYFNELLANVFTKEQVAFANNDKFIGFCAAYFSKHEVDNMKLAGIYALLNALANDYSLKDTRPLLQKVVESFTIKEEDDIYFTYHFNASAGLTDEVMKAYYKGRKIKSGRVAKSFDTNGKSVKNEIILAVIEDLQNKTRKKYEEEKKKEEEQKKQEEKKKQEEQKKQSK